MASLHGQLYEALSNYNVALKQSEQLSDELGRAMETLSRRTETLINLVHRIECPHPTEKVKCPLCGIQTSTAEVHACPSLARQEAVDKHYGVSWKDIAKFYAP